MKQKKLKKMLKPTYSKFLRKMAVWTFNKWIVYRDWFCVQCKTKDNLTCWHYISAMCSIIRFDERNCNCQCASHNYIHEYNPELYRSRMKQKYWEWVIEELANKRWTTYKRTLQELEEICIHYWNSLLERKLKPNEEKQIKMILRRIEEYNW